MVDLVIDVRTVKNIDSVNCGSLALIGWKDNIHSTFSPLFICWNTNQAKPLQLGGGRGLEEDLGVRKFQALPVLV